MQEISGSMAPSGQPLNSDHCARTATCQHRSVSEWLQSWPGLRLSADQISQHSQTLLQYAIEEYLAQKMLLRQLADALDTALTQEPLTPPVNLDACCQNLLTHVEDSIGQECIGGSAQLLRVLTAKLGAPKSYHYRLEQTLERCWEQVVTPQLNAPAHVAVICPMDQSWNLLPEFWEWYGRFPDKVTLFDLKTKPKFQTIPIRGATVLPANTSIYLICHSQTGFIFGISPGYFTLRLHNQMNQYAEASPHTIMLDSCDTAHPCRKQPSAAEVFTREWHACLSSPPTVTVIGFDDTVRGDLFRGHYSESESESESEADEVKEAYDEERAQGKLATLRARRVRKTLFRIGPGKRLRTTRGPLLPRFTTFCKPKRQLKTHLPPSK